MKVVEYMTAGGKNKDELDDDVNKHIQLGWQPFGNAYTHSKKTEDMHGFLKTYPKFQPMVRYEESK